MRLRTLTALLVATVVVAAAAPAAAQIYKWKDAKGVTKYSESPPPKGSYTVQESPRPAPAPATPAASSTPPTGMNANATASADPRCDTARKNMIALQGKGGVTQDSNNDGKPDRTLNDAERASELEVTRATLKAYNCAEPAAPAGSTART